MHRLNPKYKRIAVIVALSLFVLLLIGGFIAYSKREVLLQKAISKAKAKAKRDYNLDVKIGGSHFEGLATVDFTDITIVPENRDSLLTIKNFEVSVKIFPLLFGNIKLADVILDNGHLNLTSKHGVRNFDFLFHKNKDTTTTSSKSDLSVLANNLIKDVLYKIPDKLNVKNFLISFADDSNRVSALARTAVIADGNLTSNIGVDDGTTPSTWHFAGKMHPSDKDIDIKLYADSKKVELPIIEQKFKVKLNFDTITTRLKKVENSDGQTRIYGYWSVSNLLINHKALSSSDIVLHNGSIDANIFVGENYVSIDSSSIIHIKKLSAHPYVKYTLKPVKIYELKVNTGWLNAQDMFDSFPDGMFDALQGIKVAGKLNYHFNFFLDTSNPDGVQFDSSLDKDGLNVLQYGKTDFSKLNNPFVYTPYEKNLPMPPRTIGPQNPNYTPLEQISQNLKNAVVTAEDPTFYKNNGFVEESIRKSIAVDFKQKKFKRGGSTISMQLVKNAFLSREKTLARKVEETLIVWMLVNNKIMTKDRMLEVYFNIIEWGRNIYGIGEAAHYYFGKSPSELTQGESIFLASIVPKPKTGLYYFMPDGTLNPRLEGYFNSLGNLMVGHGAAQRDSDNYGLYTVRLRAGLRQQIAPLDTATKQRLIKQNETDDENDAQPVVPVVEEPVKKPGFFQRLFGKKDTTHKKDEIVVDTAGKTKKQIRQEKRALKKLQKEQEQELKNKGPQ